MVFLSEDYHLGMGGGTVIRGLSVGDGRWCYQLGMRGGTAGIGGLKG